MNPAEKTIELAMAISTAITTFEEEHGVMTNAEVVGVLESVKHCLFQSSRESYIESMFPER